MTSRLSPFVLDRAAGTLLGQAAGDALGSGYEFARPVRRGEAEMIGGGLGPWAPGEWTDDTQQALFLAEAAAAGLDLSTREGQAFVGQRLLEWYAMGPSDVGNQTRAVLSAAASAEDLPAAAAAYAARHDRSAGNGSLMRTGPVPLGFLQLRPGRDLDERLVAAARGVSALTHADPLAEDACVLWAFGVDRAIREGHFGGVREGVKHLPSDRQGFWTDRLDEAEGAEPSRFSPNGYVVTALQAAWAAVTSTPVPAELPCTHLTAALQGAVSAGDDTDTVAAIAGALLGARWGATALPFPYRRLLHGWPDRTGTDLVSLAALAARQGACDATGWPSASSLADHYQDVYGQRPFLVPLPGDPGVLLGNVETLGDVHAGLAEGVTTAVSLCRVGSGQVLPDHVQVWMVDTPEVEDNHNLEFLVADAARAIETLRAEGHTVLLHCVAGASRTPTVAAAYLSRLEGIDGQEALDRVTAVLPAPRPNRRFRSLMAAWPPGGPDLPV